MKLNTELPLVVLTYPGHFFLTAVTIQSYFEHNPQSPVTIIADDLSSLTWPEYLEDCTKTYNCKVIPVSKLDVAHEFADHWIRQQIVKLHLDQLLDLESWFFSDGDIRYHFPAPNNSTPFSIVKNINQNQNSYVSHILNIESAGIYTEHPDMDWVPGTTHHQVCVSNPPFRTMQANTLVQLRNYVETQHSVSLAQLHKQLDQSLSMSEWELIANFQQHILAQDINLIYYPTVPIEQEPDPNQNPCCGTCYSNDQAVGRSWFETQNITVSDDIWTKSLNRTNSS